MHQTSSQIFNTEEVSRQLNRPSPSDSATWYMPGTYKQGNDGNMYGIQVTNSGIHRWVGVGPHAMSKEILSTKHPSYGQQAFAMSNSMYGTAGSSIQHKYSVGETVRVVQSGLGCGPEDIGTEVTIIDRGTYGSDPGYIVTPAIGNSMKHPNGAYYGFNGFIGEESFELVTLTQLTTKQQTKPLNMAKSTKTITKKTTQEVRQIETSLINKEEVFKMLALAEATGLPLLLVGEPGVNSK